jgi:diketogulonate reductase-like aldo/keto reductase
MSAAAPCVSTTLLDKTSWSNADGKVNFVKAPLYATWRAMESLVDSGHAKSIGVSNCSSHDGP